MGDVLIIGGGQAGLALGYFLKQAGVDFAIVDAGPEIGHSWRARWDSLRLFTPAQYASLPGTPFPAPADSYPGRDQVAEYLAAYADRHALSVRPNTAVTRLTRSSGRYVASTQVGERIDAERVVVATGPFSKPFTPSASADFAPEVVQLHTAQYRNPDQIPGGQVLVVGGGNSGFQIAAELAASGRRTVLAEGRHNACVPQRPLGRDIFWWQDRLGLIRVTADSRLGQRMKDNDGTVIGSTRAGLRRRGVSLRPRLISAAGRTARFADDTTSTVDAVVWATGFTIDDTWIELPEALDDRGRLIHDRGVVATAPGLFTIGRPWQHTTGSALLGFVQHDARWLAEQLSR